MSKVASMTVVLAAEFAVEAFRSLAKVGLCSRV